MQKKVAGYLKCWRYCKSNNFSVKIIFVQITKLFFTNQASYVFSNFSVPINGVYLYQGQIKNILYL